MAIDERSTAKGAPALGNGPAPEQNVQAVRNTLKETIVELQKTTWPAGSKDISISGFWRRHNMRYENFQELIDA